MGSTCIGASVRGISVSTRLPPSQFDRVDMTSREREISIVSIIAIILDVTVDCSYIILLLHTLRHDDYVSNIVRNVYCEVF